MRKTLALLAVLLTAGAYPGTGAWKGLWELSNDAYTYAASRSGSVGVAVYDDTSGALYTYNGTKLFRCASIIKVGIMAAVLQKASNEGRWLTPWEQDQIGPMIKWSDNTAATNLWNYIGPDNVIAYLQSIGMTNTNFEAGAPKSWWGWVNTCAKDMTVLVSRLYYKQIATAALCDYGINVMTKIVSSQSWGVKAGVPTGTWVAFKNGWYPEETVWRVHSVGVVKDAGGKVFVVSVLTRYDVGLGQSYGIATTEGVTSRVWTAITGVPVASAAAVKVTTTTLNVRSGPGSTYPIIGQVSQGQSYIRTEEQNGWSKIYYDGNTGWCYSGYLTKQTGVTAIKVTTSSLNVRTGPGTSHLIAGKIYMDQMYFWTQYEGLNGWYKFYWKGGSYYCYGQYVVRVSLN